LFFGKDNTKMKQKKIKIYIKTIDKINKFGKGLSAVSYQLSVFVFCLYIVLLYQ